MPPFRAGQAQQVVGSFFHWLSTTAPLAKRIFQMWLQLWLHVVIVLYMETSTTQNQTYGIYVYMAKTATYDKFDGFGDYVNYGAKKICEVGASSEEEALKIAGFTDNHDQIFWASVVA